MPYLWTDYDRGYKKGMRDALSPSLLDPYEVSKQAGQREALEQSGLYFETDYTRGYRKGMRDAFNPPLLDPYKAGFEAGRRSATKDLFPSAFSEQKFEIG